MPDDLPIYSDAMLRSRLQFAALERLKNFDSDSVSQKSDVIIGKMEGAEGVTQARELLEKEATAATLLEAHQILFHGRENAGRLRRIAAEPLYRGHDCPEPQFIERSLQNFFGWLTAESISEIHPIEKAALVLTRIVDIWPFEHGNLTVGLMVANVFLRQAGFAPFFVQAKDLKEFNRIIAQAMTIETQPLVNAIYNTIKREMESLGDR